jgi:HEAT repeat protein
VFEKRDPVRKAAVAALCGPPAVRSPPPVDIDTPDGKPDAAGYVAAAASITNGATACSAEQLAAVADELRAAIASALGRHRDLVLRTLRDLDGDGAALALGPLGSGKDTAELLAPLAPTLAALAAHTDAAVRLHAMRVLAKLGEPSAEAIIVSALGDADLAVAEASAEAARIYAGHTRAQARITALASALAQRLRAPRWTERLAATRALAVDPRLSQAALSTLSSAATDPSGFVREALAPALAASADTHARLPLETLATDPVPAVRSAAEHALKSLPR